MNQSNCIVAQSGGPTVAINASLAGVIAGVKSSEKYDICYGAVNGILGILNENYLNLSDIFADDANLEKLKTTPAMYLGSCRHKLPDYKDDDSPYVYIFHQFDKLSVKAFFYIGGNDSMDTVLKLSDYAKKINSDVKIIGIPKTIDNDLCMTDHTPGFGSAAKYIASSLLEIAHDTFIYAVKSVTIVEIMGRDAGWLTAASALARNEYNTAPHFIYLPEVAFDQDVFLKDLEKAFEKNCNLIVCVSEGIHDADGTFICEYDSSVGTDTFGHKMLAGCGKYLENLVRSRLGVKARSVELNVSQRCSASLISATDQKEAITAGKFGVQAALNGETGKMVSFIRQTDSEGNYQMVCGLEDVNAICNEEKTVPLTWITSDGHDVTEDFIRYARPLIQGNIEVPLGEDGLPKFVYRK